MIKTGAVKGNSTYNNTRRAATFDIVVIEDYGKPRVLVTRTSHEMFFENGGVWESGGVNIDQNSQAVVYVGVDPTSDEFLKHLFRYADGDVIVYEWTSPLNEVPGTSGSSPLDVYPVGIEITTTDTAFNPMKVWGGTWKVVPAGVKRVWTRTA